MPDLPPGAIVSDDERPIDLVLEGGGVKGIGLVGALEVLARRKLVPQRIAGTSAGAITAALLAARYTPDEMGTILEDLDFASFKDEGLEDKVPLLGYPASVFFNQGVFEGDFFLEWIRGLLLRRDVETFGDLIYEDTDDAEFRHSLQVIASDVTGGRMLILPRDAPAFGTEPDDLPVAEAVRMSMSIPFFFEPWKWKEKLIVDGGLLSNFPVFLFDAPPERRRWHTFGLMLAEGTPKRSLDGTLEFERKPKRPAVLDFGQRIMQTMLEAHDRRYIEADSYLRTIMIPTLGVKTTEFDLSQERQAELRQSGRDAATAFLDSEWDPDEFEAIHDGPTPSRGELIQQALEP